MGKVCHGGSSQYSKENRASCHWGNQRELCDRNTEYSAACWYEDYLLLKVAEKIKWKSKGPLTSGGGVRMSVCNWRVCVLWSTDKGTVQKVIVLPRDDLQTEELVLEEVEVFKVSFDCSLSLSVTLLFISVLLCVSVVLKLTVTHCAPHSHFLHQGPHSYNYNEDLVQKGKPVCTNWFT